LIATGSGADADEAFHDQRRLRTGAFHRHAILDPPVDGCEERGARSGARVRVRGFERRVVGLLRDRQALARGAIDEEARIGHVGIKAAHALWPGGRRSRGR
jgi:hypothetical protein